MGSVGQRTPDEGLGCPACYFKSLVQVVGSISVRLSRKCRRTPRSSGATAFRQAKYGENVPLSTIPGLASCRRRPLNSSVRHTDFWSDTPGLTEIRRVTLDGWFVCLATTPVFTGASLGSLTTRASGQKVSEQRHLTRSHAQGSALGKLQARRIPGAQHSIPRVRRARSPHRVGAVFARTPT